MQTEKLTLNLPKGLVSSIDHYMRLHSLKRREQVIELALELLREADDGDSIDETIEEESDDDYERELGVAHGFDRDDDRW